MDISTVILLIAIILMVARIFGEIAAYFLVPALIGELIAGIILGPTGLEPGVPQIAFIVGVDTK